MLLSQLIQIIRAVFWASQAYLYSRYEAYNLGILSLPGSIARLALGPPKEAGSGRPLESSAPSPLNDSFIAPPFEKSLVPYIQEHISLFSLWLDQLQFASEVLLDIFLVILIVWTFWKFWHLLQVNTNLKRAKKEAAKFEKFYNETLDHLSKAIVEGVYYEALESLKHADTIAARNDILQKLRSAQDSIKATKDQTDAKKKSLEGRIHVLETDEATFDARAKRLEQQLHEANKKSVDNDTEKQERLSEISKLLTDKESADRRILELENSLHTSQEHNKELVAEKLSLQNQVKDQQTIQQADNRRITFFSNQLSSAQEHARLMTEQYEAEVAAKRTLQQSLDTTSAYIDHVNNEAETRYDNLVRKHEDEIQKKTEELKNALEDVETYKRSGDAFVEANMDLEDKIEGLQEEKNHLKSEIEMLKQQEIQDTESDQNKIHDQGSDDGNQGKALGLISAESEIEHQEEAGASGKTTMTDADHAEYHKRYTLVPKNHLAAILNLSNSPVLPVPSILGWHKSTLLVDDDPGRTDLARFPDLESKAYNDHVHMRKAKVRREQSMSARTTLCINSDRKRLPQFYQLPVEKRRRRSLSSADRASVMNSLEMYYKRGSRLHGKPQEMEFSAISLLQAIDRNDSVTIHQNEIDHDLLFRLDSATSKRIREAREANPNDAFFQVRRSQSSFGDSISASKTTDIHAIHAFDGRVDDPQEADWYVTPPGDYDRGRSMWSRPEVRVSRVHLRVIQHRNALVARLGTNTMDLSLSATDIAQLGQSDQSRLTRETITGRTGVSTIPFERNPTAYLKSENVPNPARTNSAKASTPAASSPTGRSGSSVTPAIRRSTAQSSGRTSSATLPPISTDIQATGSSQPVSATSITRVPTPTTATSTGSQLSQSRWATTPTTPRAGRNRGRRTFTPGSTPRGRGRSGSPAAGQPSHRGDSYDIGRGGSFRGRPGPGDGRIPRGPRRGRDRGGSYRRGW